MKLILFKFSMISDRELVCKMKEKQMENKEIKKMLKQAHNKKEAEQEIKRKKEQETMRRREEEKEKQKQKQQSRRKQKYQQYANSMNGRIPILNQELEILRLEFQIEEAEPDAPEQFSENIEINKEYCWGCCCCQTNEQIELKELRVRSGDLGEFFHVKDIEDAYKKRKQIRQRYEQLHSFGEKNCQYLNKKWSEISCECFGTCLCAIICPYILCFYGVYHCYSCVSNCKYRAASRTRRVLKVYERAGKHSNLSQLQAENKIKIEQLQKSLSAIEASDRQRREQLINGSSNQIELLNLDLEKLEAQFKLGDVDNEGYTQTLASNRYEGCGCFTSRLDPYREVPCDAESLKDYCRVENGEEFHIRLKKLEQLDKEVGTCHWDCCVRLGTFCFTSCCKDLSRSNSIRFMQKSFLYYPPIVMMLPYILPFIYPPLSVYNCCQCLCDRCYRRTSRIHRLFETYDGYRAFIAKRNAL